jgi:4-methyl-5(b-hydroxyethyl)-thiazole monophosphate biosynthesis
MALDVNRVLVLLHPGFEGLEATGPIDILRRAGLEVTVASTSDSLLVTGRDQITIEADARLDDIDAESFDAIVVPGGPGIMELRGNARITSLLQAYGRASKPVAAICAAPLLLKDAGLLEGRRAAAHFTCREEIPDLEEKAPFVEDGLIFTSRGAGDCVAFGLGLAARFAGRDKAIDVAESICLSADDVPQRIKAS